MATAEEFESSQDSTFQDGVSVLRSFRTEAKQAIEKLIVEIQVHIQKRGSRNALTVLKRQLSDGITQLHGINEKFIDAHGLKGEQRKSREVYYTQVAKQASICFNQIDDYFHSRANEPPSSIAETKSSPSVKSAYSITQTELRQLKRSNNEKAGFLTQHQEEASDVEQIRGRAVCSEWPIHPFREEEFQDEEKEGACDEQFPETPYLFRTKEAEDKKMLDPNDAKSTLHRFWEEETLREISRAEEKLKSLNKEILEKSALALRSNEFSKNNPDKVNYGQTSIKQERAMPPFVPDSDAWIYDIAKPETYGNSQKQTNHLSKLKLRTFSGDPKEWPMFLASFKSMVHDVVSDNAQRLTYLRELLAPNIRKSISQALQSPFMYPRALQQLQKRYGHPILVSDAYIQSLVNIPAVKGNDFLALHDFFAEVHDAVTLMKEAGYEQDLLAPSILNQMRDKLPSYFRSLWGQHLVEFQRMPNLLDFDEWLENVVMGETLVQPTSVFSDAQKQPKTKQHRKTGEYRERPPTVLTTSTAQGPLSSTCVLCKAQHRLPQCPKFTSLSKEERIVIVKDLNCCFRCLIPGHQSKNCRRNVTCGISGCKGKHHPMLHDAPRISNGRGDTQKPDTKHVGHIGTAVTTNVTLLSVIPIQIQANGKNVDTFALLDSGSEVSLIKEEMAKELGLGGRWRNIRFGTFHGRDPNFVSRLVSFNVGTKENDVVFPIENAYTVPALNLSYRKIDWPQERRHWQYLADLPIAATDSSLVTVLLGMDCPEVHEQLDIRKPPPGIRGPRATLTPFGWCVSGTLPTTAQNEAICHVNLLRSETDRELASLVENFWKVDIMGTQIKEPLLNNEDKRALQILDETTKKVNGRYESGLLWKEDAPSLPNNRALALKRFFALERKLLNNEDLAAKYSAVIKEYLQLGHARKLLPEELEGPVGKTWYLPHHAVLNQFKPNKVRVVFDASARCGDTSLNDSLLKGPDLLTSAIGILLRFRMNVIPLSADIEKMYHQVLVKKDDQSAFRFVWREPGSTESPHTYQMVVHVFGAVSSPATCLYALQRTAKDHEDEFANVSAKVKNSFYVDNYLDSVNDEKEAIQVVNDLRSLLLRGGFRLTKWLTSSRTVLNAIPAEDRSNPVVNLDFENLPSERTLGLLWDCEIDCFTFDINLPVNISTKRKILSAVASIYDPLGFLSPTTLSAKTLLQEIWRSGCDWDEPLPGSILNRWQKWAGQLHALKNIKIERCLRNRTLPVDTQLHVFTDASSIGYGAVMYLRHVYEDSSVSVRFVMAKGRVAPIKPLSIPRLELQGAIIGLRLAQTCCREMQISLRDVIFWTDSQTVLQWLHSTKYRFHTFVANRVGEILEETEPNQWHHVRGKENPADDCTRDSSKTSMMRSSRWVNGPEFLWKLSYEIPRFVGSNLPKEASEEIVSENWVGTVTESPPSVSLLIQKTSNIHKLKRIIAYVLRFVNATRKKTQSKSLLLDPEELESALLTCVKICQDECFGEDRKNLKKQIAIPKGSCLTGLDPFLDKTNILRVGGRLNQSVLSYEIKHPIVLPGEHHLTTLITQEVHQRLFHSSTERTLHEMRSQYWILKGRITVRKVINRCFACKQRTAKPTPPMMASLPASRTTPFEPPFTFTGVDYFGPLFVAVKRSTEKRWGCLFTCLTTRAVHIELARNLDTDSFLMCYRRFVSRRRTPSVMYSDNGTNLTAGERELRLGLEALNQDKILNLLANKRVKWHFSPPAAPHFGGAWESLVKSTKSALKKVFGKQTTNEEVLQTVMVEIESLLNGRPLTHLSIDPRDPEPLTPNHFLLGHAHPNLPPDVVEPSELTSRRKWRMAQAMTNHFWKRWLKEYLPYLAKRKKWTSGERNYRQGDVVLVIDNQSPRGYWPIGIITEVYPGPDGIIRSARIKTKMGEYVRPVVKLCLLESSTEDCNSIV